MNVQTMTGGSATVRRGRIPVVRSMLAVMGIVMLVASCARRPDPDSDEAAFTRVFTPQVPEFLSGPAGALLTNTAGFSARAAFESDTPETRYGLGAIEGELLSYGTRLLFAPRVSSTPDAELRLGGFSFVWDVATGSGYVMSEALQGYAPVSSSFRVTHVAVQPTSAPGEQTGLVTMSDGSTSLFRLWRAGDSKNPPARLSTVTNSPAFTLRLTKIRFEAPPANLFVPPSDFVKYATPEALADELAVRQHNARRRG